MHKLGGEKCGVLLVEDRERGGCTRKLYSAGSCKLGKLTQKFGPSRQSGGEPKKRFKEESNGIDQFELSKACSQIDLAFVGQGCGTWRNEVWEAR